MSTKHRDDAVYYDNARANDTERPSPFALPEPGRFGVCALRPVPLGQLLLRRDLVTEPFPPARAGFLRLDTKWGSVDVSERRHARGTCGGRHGVGRAHIYGSVLNLTFGSIRFQYGLARSSFASAMTGAFELSPWPDRLRLSMHAQMASHRPSHESSSP